MKQEDLNIAVVGLGYVGLPLAVEFGKLRSVVGFDISDRRIIELNTGSDSTHEVTSEELLESKGLHLTSNLEDLQPLNCYIVAVPTPIGTDLLPDLSLLRNASKIVGSVLRKNDLVIYESTVFPGCTEKDCVPVLEEYSGLKFNADFFCGYSPERINPGDKKHRLIDIKKITSGSNPEIACLVDSLYSSIIVAGTHKVSSIQVAEAAKVIENTQRDLNVALVNEFAMIFSRLGIDTEAVLEAAGSKWNFLPFRPGLVGGHCIGVDPYYLTYSAQQVGYQPEIILAGRRLNDSMGQFVARRLISEFDSRSIELAEARVLVMGLTFKENCPDIRNTRVIDIIKELNAHGCICDVFDPWVSKNEVEVEFGLEPVSKPREKFYDGIIIAVAHQEFKALGADAIRSWGKDRAAVYDLKYVLTREESDLRL